MSTAQFVPAILPSQVDQTTAKIGHSLDVVGVDSLGRAVAYAFRDKRPTPYNQRVLSKVGLNIKTKFDAGLPVNVYVGIDSLVDQTHGYKNVLRQALARLCGDAGMGMTGLTALWEWRSSAVTKDANWSTEQPDVETDDEKRLALLRWIMVDAAGGGTMTIDYGHASVEGTFTSLDLYVQEGATCNKALTVRTLTSAGATVTTQTLDLTADLSGDNYRKITLTGFGASGTATKLQVTSTVSGRVALLGATYKRTSSTGGVRVHNYASGGAQLQQFAVLNETLQSAVLTDLGCDLLILEGGINDAVANAEITQEDYESYLSTIINRFRSVNPDCAVLLMSPIYADDYEYADQMMMTENAMRSLANSMQCAWLKYSDILGPFADAAANGLMADDVHPSSEGHKLIASALLDIIGSAQFAQGKLPALADTAPLMDVKASDVSAITGPIGIGGTAASAATITIINKADAVPAMIWKQTPGNTNTDFYLQMYDVSSNVCLGITPVGRINQYLQAAATVCWSGRVLADTIPRIQFTAAGKVSWGPGGSSALDVSLERFTTNTLIVSNNSTGAGHLQFKAGGSIIGPTGSGGLKFLSASNQYGSFWGVAPVQQQVLATGAGKVVDDVITLLQTLGLCKQS